MVDTTKIGVDRFIEEMRTAGWKVSDPLESGGQKWAIIDEYNIPCGRFSGTTIRIAIQVPPDYPAICPGGFYISPALINPAEMQGLAVHGNRTETAGLPGEWQLWSRKFPQGMPWKAGQNARRLPPHWNGVLCRVA